MSFVKKLERNRAIIENVIFIGAFVFFVCYVLSLFGLHSYQSIKGKGYLGTITEPFLKHTYYLSIVAGIVLLNSVVNLWEIVTLMIKLWKDDRNNPEKGYLKYKALFKQLAINYKSPILGMVVLQLLPKLLLIHMFWIWLPHFQKYQLFTVNLKWYSWIYGYLCWEFSSWLWHYSSHRVRFLWCLHSPHHAPTELNMMANWLHFFAEGYYSTIVFLIISTIFGLNPVMSFAIIMIDGAWGIFIHISERSLKDGRLGFLHHLIITPAHHRAHHSKNPLYLDTNFANVVPIWDWIMGTLQPLKDEVKPEYGITRELDVTNFSDLYFGEIFLLYRDVKNAEGIKNKLRYIFMSPGWSPASTAQTAAVIRQEFLKTNPALGVTNRGKFLNSIKSRFRGYKPEPQVEEMPVPVVSEL